MPKVIENIHHECCCIIIFRLNNIRTFFLWSKLDVCLTALGWLQVITGSVPCDPYWATSGLARPVFMYSAGTTMVNPSGK